MARKITDEIELLYPIINHHKSPMNFKALKRRCSSKRVPVSFDEIMDKIVAMLRLQKFVISVHRDRHTAIVTWRYPLSARQLWRAEQRLSEAVDIVFSAYDQQLRLHS